MDRETKDTKVREQISQMARELRKEGAARGEKDRGQDAKRAEVAKIFERAERKNGENR